MSSDAFRIRVLSVDGPVVVLESQPTLAGGLADLCFTRSFVLLLAQARGAALEGDAYSEPWVRENVDRYLAKTEVLSITGLESEEAIRGVHQKYETPLEALQPVLRLRATFREEALARCFTPGDSFGTTAWDLWWDDPLRPTLPPLQEPRPYAETREEAFPPLRDALAARVPPEWSPEGSSFTRDLGVLRWTLSIMSDGYIRYLPPEQLWVSLTAAVPAVDARRAPGTRKKPQEALTFLATQLPSAEGHSTWWRRRTEDGPEPVDAVAERVRAQLLRAEAVLADCSTEEGLLARVEAAAEDGAPGQRLKSFRRLVPPRPVPETQDVLLVYASLGPAAVRYYSRAALLRAFGHESEARDALAQARSRWKSVPKLLEGAFDGL